MPFQIWHDPAEVFREELLEIDSTFDFCLTSLIFRDYSS